MAKTRTEEKLQKRTEEYWQKWQSATSATDMLAKYIGEPDESGMSLLQAEMDWARHDDPARLPQYPGETLTLVLLVGYSIEPLLQAIYAYQPSRVLLLLNARYLSLTPGGREKEYALLDWKAYGEQVRSAVAHIIQQNWFYTEPKRHLQSENIDCKPIGAATPVHVFQTLLKHLHGDSNVIVDITGAKKSMVAGAFLYAAFANVPVSYVDFDDDKFNPEHAKPYGYGCRIGQLVNPYEKFALRDWERVRSLYLQSNYQLAKDVLARIRQTVRTDREAALTSGAQRLREPLDAELSAITRLSLALRWYALWNNGNYHGAWRHIGHLRSALGAFEPPTAVRALGENWPHSSSPIELIEEYEELQFGAKPSDSPVPEKSILLNLDHFISYAEDEYAKLVRLIKPYEDYRSALLRAAGLSEILLKARLALAWRKSWLSLYKNNERTTSSVEEWEQVFKALVEGASAKSIFKTLWEQKRMQVNKTDKKKWQVLLNPPPDLTLVPFWSSDFAPPALADLRNQSIHVCLYVQKPLAQQAVTLARANLDDYERNWARYLGALPSSIVTTAMPWEILCERCGLSQFLPPNLMRKEMR